MGAALCGNNAKPGNGLSCRHFRSLRKNYRWWKRLGGAELEAALCCNSVRLVDADWLVKLANTQGGLFQRRQDLPHDAFVTCEELQAAGPSLAFTLPIFVVSHPWLQPDHPDPKGTTLKLLAMFLEPFLKASRKAKKAGRYGVMFDFASLFQHPRDSTHAEGDLFIVGLKSLNNFYAHRNTMVLKVTSFPEAYPDGYYIPGDANVKPYSERGWCYAESAMSGLVKGIEHVFDVSKFSGNVAGSGPLYLENVSFECAAGLSPPMVPEDFNARLSEKTFTNKKDDFDKVRDLYKRAYDTELPRATVLKLWGDWGDDEMKTLSKVLASGACAKLKHLSLSQNRIADEGAMALAAALVTAGALPALRSVNLEGNQITEAGREALEAAVKGSTLIELDFGSMASGQ